MRAAAEAVIELLDRAHPERRGLLVVERTAGAVLAAGLLEFDARADELDDVRACGQVVDEALGNAAGHTANIGVWLTPYLPEDGENDEHAGQQRRDRSADDQRQTLARKPPELPALGFDLAGDGDADERDEDQRAGGGYATSAQLTAELGFDAGADGAHVGLARRLALHHAHDLAHVLDGRGAGAGDGFGDEGIEIGIGKLRGQIRLQDRDFRSFFRDEVRTRAFLEGHDGFLALLDHLLEHGSDLRVVERDALVDFTLLDGRLQKTNDRETILFAGSHRGLHVFGDALFERHLRSVSSGA